MTTYMEALEKLSKRQHKYRLLYSELETFITELEANPSDELTLTLVCRGNDFDDE